MGRGYAEGPAAEALHEAQERGERGDAPREIVRKAVWGSTRDQPEQHFIGYLGDVDPDELFASGQAWGVFVTVERG
jgi:hypothetical protein